jgi:acetoacetyl-CoA synthetase
VAGEQDGAASSIPRARADGDAAGGESLWTPSEQRARDAAITHYTEWLAAERGLEFGSLGELWAWSVDDLGGFWDSIWEFCAVRGERGGGPALADDAMPGAHWFPGARVNYAENALTRRGAAPAVIAVREDATTAVVSWDRLRRDVGACAAGLRALGVRTGDRVCAVLPNGVHAVVAMLATASIGAVWSSCAPDFGPTGIVDRFGQIDPMVMIGVDGYTYGGESYDGFGTLSRVAARLPSLRSVVVVPYLGQDALDRARRAALPGVIAWDELLADASAELAFTRLPFDAPLWVLYSSGSSGPPKAIVHGHGGILLEHLKTLALHLDLGPDDRFAWMTTTGWMMWNFAVSGLLVGSALVLYDGSPTRPDLGVIWRLAEAVELTCLGVGAAFLASCARTGAIPSKIADLSRLRTLGSTGSPLTPDLYRWVYDTVSPDVMLTSISGGTDVCTAFALGAPTLPVRAGEMSTRGLGCAVETFDAAGRPVVGEVGELVVTRPMPSMPTRLWGDDGGALLRETYFSRYEGVWRHGDWARITPDGAVTIHGRSDATLNRGGIRIGTAELYRVVEEIRGIVEAVVVDTSGSPDDGAPRGTAPGGTAPGGTAPGGAAPGGGGAAPAGELILFVRLESGYTLDAAFAGQIRSIIRAELSPRHVPDRIEAVAGIPRTHNGKKLEIPIKRLLLGVPLERAVNLGAVANPETLAPFAHVQAPASG